MLEGEELEKGDLHESGRQAEKEEIQVKSSQENSQEDSGG